MHKTTFVRPVNFMSIRKSCRISVSHASPGNHLSEKGAGPLEGSSIALADRPGSAAQEHLREETSKVRNLSPVKNGRFVRLSCESVITTSST